MLLLIEALLLILAALGQDHRAAGAGYPLDMALNSVDDQYKGCTSKMAHLVKTKYLMKEINNSPQFKIGWQVGAMFVKFPKGYLKRNHLIAIYVYSDNNVYQHFNPDNRYGKKQYNHKTYKWYSLYFLLTEAIQILKKTQYGCRFTYRGTNVEFNKDVLNKEVRFGSFASSSLDYNIARGFGSKSCFEIYTCEGADVAKYSKYPHEKEVLIPPYEKFKVTAVKSRKYQPHLWCETVFTLKSTGTRSYLNCALFKKAPNYNGFY
ncbi:NAD(P)(+)--arginine ADP-ribosyltransferase 2-like [Sinocyclocheilus anshuiensis]|uniref:NAD(P)(+)--arginine ADP-ribosyltransferase 2-like n=1 Tax=Sinocyclocheilus anshuiensis TaxID=1608454 RepID=UPI0007B87EF7|nr:PREDICTED: NAD(P)(+)--arginine ADP-ribosyltransferase 2-like [Sinocyclocheilus anshuiensis]